MNVKESKNISNITVAKGCAFCSWCLNSCCKYWK